MKNRKSKSIPHLTPDQLCLAIMDQLATRLWGNTGDKYPGFQNLNTEAAAEIERLRDRVAELEAERDRWKSARAAVVVDDAKAKGGGA